MMVFFFYSASYWYELAYFSLRSRTLIKSNILYNDLDKGEIATMFLWASSDNFWIFWAAYQRGCAGRISVLLSFNHMTDFLSNIRNYKLEFGELR